MHVTITITEQIRETPSVVTPVRLTLIEKKAAVENKLNNLLLQLRNSGLFSGDELDQIATWELEFFRDYLTDLETEETQENVSMALCYLQENIIIAVLWKRYHDAPPQQQDLLLDFADELKGILKLTVPGGIEVDDFISAYRAYDEEEQTFNFQIAVINSFFQAKQEELVNFARASDMKLIQQYNVLRARLNEVHGRKEAAGTKAIAVVGELTAKIDCLYNNVIQNEKSLAEIMKMQELHEAAFQNTLKNCQTIVNRGTRT